MHTPLQTSELPPDARGVVDARTRLTNVLLVTVQLVLIGGLIDLFEIESQRYLLAMYGLVVCGFVVHVWLPNGVRPGFFAILSAASVPFILGLSHGLIVLGIGGVLIVLCLLPIRLFWRATLLTVAGALLVALRFRWPSPIWPVLGSLFMFRVLIYVYSTRKAGPRPSWAESVSYFFVAPNACFPLFPVVDFRTYRDCWDRAEEWETYQRGITWIVRGISHLLLYRGIKAYLVPAAYELHDVMHLAWFMVSNYALYLHVSGQFHLITGLLHLFGFDLPRTHDHFFLASSFTDIWRRINIYWKDFMSRLFFFPAFYAARRRGFAVAPATVLSVLCVFVATWLLHSWQTYWLLGRFPVTVNDAALWMGVGVCVAANALLDARRGERPTRPVWIQTLGLAARIVGMFALVSLFWACWTMPGFLALAGHALARPGAGRALMTLVLWMLAAVAIVTAVALLRRQWLERGFALPVLSVRERGALNVAGLGAVCWLASPFFVDSVLDRQMAETIAEFRSGAAALTDAGGLLQGYYEDLNQTAIQAGPLIATLTPQDESRRLQAAGFELVSRRADRYQQVELIPGATAELLGRRTTINRFGMRDRSTLTLHKPPGTIRIALVGSSVVMGYGVADDETFSRLFENQLNAESSRPGVRYEVLNFGVGQQWATHRLVRIQRQVLGFEPDAIYYFAHQDELQSLAGHIASLTAAQARMPSERLQTIVDEMNLTPDIAEGAIQSALQQREADLLRAVYRTIIEECRSRGIVAVWIYLPIPTSEAGDPVEQLIPIAREAGFVTCDLSDWASGRSVDEILRSPNDHHPHAGGHRLIAEALVEMVRAHPEALP